MAPKKAAGKILLYGANGFTGRATVDLVAKDEELFTFFKTRLVLAGRSASKLQTLAEKTGLPYRAFALNDAAAVDRALADVRVVIHMAGPFVNTCEPMLQGCIRNHCDYLDITGEHSAMQTVHEKYADKISQAEILAISGVGFDIVPTDCIAAMLVDALPNATHLDLAFASRSMTPSAGTTLSAVEAMHIGSPMCARENGRMAPVGIASSSRQVEFPTLGSKYCTFFPWGDCYTAYVTTGIPNVHVYLPSTPLLANVMYYGAPITSILLRNIPYAASLVKSLIAKLVTGPTAEVMKSGTIDVWGEARDAASGARAHVSAVVPDGYRFTALASLECARRVFEGRLKKRVGPSTPGLSFGSKFVGELPGVTLHEVVVENRGAGTQSSNGKSK